MVKELNDIVTTAERTAKSVGSGYSILDEVEGLLSTAAGASFVEGTAEGGVAVAGAAAGSAVAATIIPLTLAALLLLLFCRQIQHAMIMSIPPIPWAKGKITNIINFLFHPLDMFHDWVLNKMIDAASELLHHFVVLISWAILQPTVETTSNVDAAIKHRIDPVHREVDHLWSWVNQLNHWVGRIATEVNTTPNGQPSPVPQDVYDQIQQTQHQLRNMQHQLIAQEHQIENLTATVQQFMHSFENLSSKVHGARAVNTGWQDIEKSLEELQRRVETLQEHLNSRVTGTEQQLQFLAPLSVLSEPGLRGILNLRRLEDNPCQCPRLPHIGNELGLALSMYEFISYG